LGKYGGYKNFCSDYYHYYDCAFIVFLILILMLLGMPGYGYGSHHIVSNEE